MKKTCLKCKKLKSMEEFHINNSSKDGRVIYCKSCCSKIAKGNYTSNPDIHRERSRLYRERHKHDPEYIRKYREQSRRYQLEHKEEIQERKLKNRDKLLARRRELRQIKHETSPELLLLEASKDRARKKGLKHTITRQDIIIPTFCPVLGIPLKIGIGKPIPNSPSIDRIDNTKGYTKDNIVIVSWRVNDLKRNSTLDELEKIVKFYKGLQHG